MLAIFGLMLSLGGGTNLIQDYEAIRAALAADQAEAAIEAARVLAARVHVPQAVKAAAKSLANAQPPGDLTRQRRHFGALSESVIHWLATQPGVQSTLAVHRCPMARGYTQWVQPPGKRSNPYMGQRMLQCGSAGEWHAAKPR